MKDKELLEKFKMNVAINNLKSELAEEHTLTKENKWRDDMKNIFKIGVAACLMVVSVTGMVFAKEISTTLYENFFHTGDGMETAMNEGYIENTTMDYQNSNANMENEETGEIIEDAETQIKASEFVMDDFNLSMTFDVTLSEKAQEMITTEEVFEMNFPDLVIYDENEVVLFSMFRDSFDAFCEKHHLDYNYDTKPDEKWVNTGVNTFVSEKDENHVKVIYNIYTDGSPFPKSKKLNMEMKKIKISKDETVMGDEEITLTGDWNFTVDVPKKMYSRTNLIYKQKSTTNKDFNVTSARIYDTGMDISLKFPAEKLPKEPTTPEIEFWKSLPQEEELKDVDILNYLEVPLRNTPEYQEYMKKSMNVWQYDKYLTNEKDEKFGMTEGPRENGGGSIDEETGIYTSNCTFDLTKYDATDTITLYVDYHGNTAEIVLEKVEEK